MAESRDRDQPEACGSSPPAVLERRQPMNEADLRRKLRNFPSARLAQRINSR
jgi:hypothetical protein